AATAASTCSIAGPLGLLVDSSCEGTSPHLVACRSASSTAIYVRCGGIGVLSTRPNAGARLVLIPPEAKVKLAWQRARPGTPLRSPRPSGRLGPPSPGCRDYRRRRRAR